jgi:hypothetical protein
MIGGARIMYRMLFEGRVQPREPFVSREPLVLIGRDPSCQLRLVEDGVSDRHAAIERREDGYYIRDLDRANGVRVNGQPVKQQRLASGDELELGSLRLKFEIVHEPPRQRPPFDALQWVAGAVVAAILAGQIWLFAWILSQPHPKRPRGGHRRATATLSAVTETPDVSQPAGTVPPTQAAPSAAPAVPTVLDRMIRILRIERSDGPDGVTLTIQARAQVGDRVLDNSATAICVQFFGLDNAGQAVPLREPVWLSIPPWENFATRTFVAKFSGPPQQLAGFVARTYYRGKPQDVAGSPASLLAHAPDPMR